MNWFDQGWKAYGYAKTKTKAQALLRRFKSDPWEKKMKTQFKLKYNSTSREWVVLMKENRRKKK